MKSHLQHYCRFILASVTITLLSSFSTLQSPTPGEFKIKAMFLFNFAQFVDWPPESFSDTEDAIVIGILGEDPFGNFLDQTVQNETINGRPLKVQRFQSADEIKQCHILFISKSHKEQYSDILATLKGKNILTVSDAQNFSDHGGIIRFINDDNKVKLGINVDAAKSENLSISSKLLRISQIVKQEKEN